MNQCTQKMRSRRSPSGMVIIAYPIKSIRKPYGSGFLADFKRFTARTIINWLTRQHFSRRRSLLVDRLTLVIEGGQIDA